MQNARVPIIGFAAFSGTGKTTLLTQIIPLLKRKGLNLGVIKHSHHNFEIDKPGKDSFRLRTAGASPVMLVSSHRRAIITEFSQPIEPVLDEQLKFLDQSVLDLIMVEGFKSEHFPKIELHRPILNKPLLCLSDPDIVAVASDQRLDIPAHIPQLNLNDINMIADFILQRLIDTSS